MTNVVRSFLRSFATAAVILGPILGIMTVVFALHTSIFVRHASRTTGTITAVTALGAQDSNTTYATTFAFQTPSGELITKQSTVDSNPPEFFVRQQVPILFDPNAPQNAKIATLWQLWLLPIVFGILSIVFTPVGFLLLRRPEIRTVPLPFWTNKSHV